MGDDHLTGTAIFCVFLDDNNAPGFADRLLNHLAIPRRNRTKIDQFDARFVPDLLNCFERLLHRVAPRN